MAWKGIYLRDESLHFFSEIWFCRVWYACQSSFLFNARSGFYTVPEQIGVAIGFKEKPISGGNLQPLSPQGSDLNFRLIRESPPFTGINRATLPIDLNGLKCKIFTCREGTGRNGLVGE